MGVQGAKFIHISYSYTCKSWWYMYNPKCIKLILCKAPVRCTSMPLILRYMYWRYKHFKEHNLECIYSTFSCDLVSKYHHNKMLQVGQCGSCFFVSIRAMDLATELKTLKKSSHSLYYRPGTCKYCYFIFFKVFWLKFTWVAQLFKHNVRDSFFAIMIFNYNIQT